jgi:hypothetical protein
MMIKLDGVDLGVSMDAFVSVVLAGSVVLAVSVVAADSAGLVVSVVPVVLTVSEVAADSAGLVVSVVPVVLAVSVVAADSAGLVVSVVPVVLAVSVVAADSAGLVVSVVPVVLAVSVVAADSAGLVVSVDAVLSGNALKSLPELDALASPELRGAWVLGASFSFVCGFDEGAVTDCGTNTFDSMRAAGAVLSCFDADDVVEVSRVRSAVDAAAPSNIIRCSSTSISAG